MLERNVEARVKRLTGIQRERALRRTPGGNRAQVGFLRWLNRDQSHLRTILSPLQVLLMGQPEAYVHYKAGLIDETHTVTDERIRALLQSYIDAFGLWIEMQKASV